jgi:hypothetical protein
MSRFDNINESIKTTRRKYSLNLKDAQENNGDIEINNVNTEKQAKGTFSVSNDILTISIIESSYNENYLKNIIINDLLDSNLAVNNIEINFNTPKVGATIATKLFLQNSIGDVVNLNKREYYNSVNSDFVNCNGWPLQKSFRARLERKEDKRCEGSNLQALTYTFFKLISEI